MRRRAPQQALGGGDIEDLVRLRHHRRPVVTEISGNDGKQGQRRSELLIIGAAEQIPHRDTVGNDPIAINPKPIVPLQIDRAMARRYRLTCPRWDRITHRG